ncbi:hypothetical protein AQUCO_09900004v1 [Aquilegia coerulea]|uniref:Uncharacterized protein n=1 Tax=Aquilegia coerulea TaxID=218851 RepID=A0A2G5C4A0_AQUCA|nr:hypothetical protein AQUCO_09900004v1 [Aquilegia coerulea]
MKTGETFVYTLADKLYIDANQSEYVNLYHTEFLNSLNPHRFPLFSLMVKSGSRLLPLRDLAHIDGMRTGTRLMVTQCVNQYIQVKILTENKPGEIVFIPRITLTSSFSNAPFQITRTQFPVMLDGGDEQIDDCN